MKYETTEWGDFRFGTRFFAHGQLHSDHDNGITDPYNADIESDFTLPELYLSYGFLDNSSVTLGRWDHRKVSHIDDAQSEGGYISFKEIENLELIAGIMRRFAEIDYDDGENFGRNNKAQDLDSDGTYGVGSGPLLVFIEGKYQPMDILKLNPYFMYHDDYASVFGIDTGVSAEWEETGIKYGGNVIYEHVNADVAGSSDANILVIQPFVEKGPVKLKFSYSKFSKGDSLNHPGWLDDSFNLVDQDVAKNNPGAEIYESVVKYSWEKVWVSYVYASAHYDTSSSRGEGYSDNEFQVGYNITDDLDINLRYFIVTFDDIDDRDYNKIETRMRFKF